MELPAIHSVGPRVQIDSTIRRAQRLLTCMLCAAGVAAVVLSQLKVYSPDWERDIPHPMIAQGTLVTACLIGVLTFGWAVHHKRSAAVPSVIYALCQGVVIGALTIYVSSLFGKILLMSVGLTTVLVLLALMISREQLYSPSLSLVRLIRRCVIGISLVYVVTALAQLQGVEIPWLYDNTPIGIAFSVSVALLATAETFLSMEEIRSYEQDGAPAELEHFLALDLIAGVVWIYVETVVLCFKWLMHRLAWGGAA